MPVGQGENIKLGMLKNGSGVVGAHLVGSKVCHLNISLNQDFEVFGTSGFIHRVSGSDLICEGGGLEDVQRANSQIQFVYDESNFHILVIL